MSFEVVAEAYGQFMGRYSERLATEFVAFAGVAEGQRALDVGCGTGVLTAVLADLLGADAVSAVDPSESFVEAARASLDGVDVRRARAEELPFADGMFDVALAQLVVHFMKDPVEGLREMARVTQKGGLVAACVWDHAGGRSPLSPFWSAVLELDPGARDEADLPGAREGHLGELFAAAGLQRIKSTALTVRVGFASFEEWWQPFTLGVGPAGDYVGTLDATQKATLRERCAAMFPAGEPFAITASAWTATGSVR